MRKNFGDPKSVEEWMDVIKTNMFAWVTEECKPGMYLENRNDYIANILYCIDKIVELKISKN